MRHNRAGRLAAGPIVAVAAMALGGVGLGFLGTAAAVADPAGSSCTANVGNSGLTAAVVAQPHQRIVDQTIDATGCDIGIYVGEGASHVTIDSVTVSGASFQGILAEKTSYLSVESSTITDNGYNTINLEAPELQGSGLTSFVGQAFGISLFGVSHSTVAYNSVFNNGRGGIGVMDNGPNDPGTITQDASAPLVASSYDKVIGNRTWMNYSGCGIVLATQNFAGSLSHMIVVSNTVTGTGFSATNGPDIGGIVVAADPPESTVSDVAVSGNTVTGSFEGGLIVNAESFNSSTNGVKITGNTVTANNWGHLEAPSTAGIIVSANPGAIVPPGTAAPENIGTVVAGNTATEQFYGVWSTGSYPPLVRGNQIEVSPGGTPIVPLPTQQGGQSGDHGRHLGR